MDAPFRLKDRCISAKQVGFQILLGLLLISTAWAGPPSDGSPRVSLTQGWEYRWGDSPVDGAGRPVWTRAGLSDPDWKPFDLTDGLPKNRDFNHVWCRIELPEGSWRDPALLIKHVLLVFEAYLGDRLIYRSGDLRPASGNKYQALRWHMVPLPDGFQGKTLALRVYSDSPRHIGPGHKVRLGSRTDLVSDMVRGDLPRIFVGDLLILIGLFGFYIFLRRREKSALSLGGLAFCVGLYTVAGSDLAQLRTDMPALWWYLGMVPFYLFPVGMWAFHEQVMAPECGRAFRRMWQVHLAYATGAVALDVADVVPLPVAVMPFLCLLMCGMVISAIVGYRSASRGSAELKTLFCGMGILMLFGLHDILRGFGIIPGEVFVFHWGVFLFVLVLVTLLERRFVEAHARLQAYSGELEAQSENLRISNEKLEEYSHTLEDRVSERTRDLREKNGQLEEAMAELRETQDQLIMREKMASLGNLVAGVAHEINTPIGAVNSAADVSERCIDRVMGVLKASASWGEFEADGRFRQAAKLLADNTRLITTAGERIATIVRSLRRFARLDEAEFQQADLREGLDSTLTLVHHELKNRVEVVRDYADIPPIDCYPNQLNQVFMNLLINAAHAIEGRGTITVRTYPEAENVCVQIADTGKGIPPEHLDRVFDPGFTTKGVGVGTGLGLSITYNIVERHNGRIEVESTPGEGTVFTIRLPVAADVQAH